MEKFYIMKGYEIDGEGNMKKLDMKKQNQK